MATVTLSPTVASVRAAKPTYVYGATALVPLLTSASAALVRVGMPSDIPANATVVSAVLTLQQAGAATGAITLTAQRHSATWTMSKVNWSNRPGVGGTVVTPPAKTAPPADTLWTFDVTADVAAFVLGTVANYGWRLSNSTSNSLNMRGSAASLGKPYLTITYLTPTDAPINLNPTGNQAVSVAKPWLTFQAPPDTTAINVQVDTDMLSTFDFDSGDVATSVGVLDLSTTIFGGLVAGTPRYWRARTKSALGYSPFSAWAQVQLVAKPTVTITSPTATSDDTTPPVVWSVAGGTQQAWQVIITSSAAKVLADSGRIVGTETTWTPPKAVTTEGTSANVEVRVWDAIDRATTANDPPYARATLTFTAAGTASVTPATSCTTTNDSVAPAVVVTATRAAAPDSWTVVRDGVRIASGLALASTSLSYTDWTADPNKAHVYRAAPYTNGTGTASGGPTSTITPRCRGIWLIDPANPTSRAVIWGDDDGDWDASEIAVIHTPIAGPPVRRVAYRPPASGSVSGDLVDVGSYTADAQIAVLWDFKSNDRDLQLVLGDRNLLVRVGDLSIRPTPDSNANRHSTVSFAWWEQGTPPWSP